MRSAVVKSLLIATGLALPLACGGQNNVADCKNGKKGVPCSAQTKEEQARNALNNGDYDTAITLLTQLLTDEPTNYSRHPLLAAAYAARGGLSILDIAKAQFGGSGGSIFTTFSSFIPGPNVVGAEKYKSDVTDMGLAVNVLHQIPAAMIAATSADAYAQSAQLQLTLYQSAYSIMYINEFAVSATTGALDPNQLQTMSEDDAVNILSSLTAAGSTPAAASSASPAVQAKINDALTQIAAEPGDTQKDKLTAFIAANQASKSSGLTDQ